MGVDEWIRNQLQRSGLVQMMLTAGMLGSLVFMWCEGVTHQGRYSGFF